MPKTVRDEVPLCLTVVERSALGPCKEGVTCFCVDIFKLQEMA